MLFCLNTFIHKDIKKNYTGLRIKFRKRTVLIYEKNVESRQTVFRVNPCVKVLFNLFIQHLFIIKKH
jgi:hypothetical protein